MENQIRCHWTGNDPLMNEYHDVEWGVPLHDDRKHFEFIVLDAAQAGLSWKTVLYKRENYRKALDNFNPETLARYTDKDIARLMENPGIIRNKLKVNSIVTNAQAFLKVQELYSSFDTYIWQFTDGQTIQNAHGANDKLPATMDVSDRMSKELKKLGFKFVGSTICYAYMQAAGMVNDHTINCFRHSHIKEMSNRK